MQATLKRHGCNFWQVLVAARRHARAAAAQVMAVEVSQPMYRTMNACSLPPYPPILALGYSTSCAYVQT